MNSMKLVIGEREFKCPFGLGFIGECLDSLGLNVYELGQKLDDNPFKFVPAVMYESIKYEQGELDFTQKDLVKWLDEDEKGLEIMNDFLFKFVQSLTKNVPKAEETTDSSKKK